MENFVYVVNPPEIPRVAFGSCQERTTLPMSGPGLSSFMRKMQGEIRDFPGPLEYVIPSKLGKKLPSNLGFSAFVSKLPRLPPTDISTFPPIGHYNVDKPRDLKKAFKPFGSGVALTVKEAFLTPGPSTYSHYIKRPGLKICSAFGSKRIIWPAVAVFCTPNNVAKCIKCAKTPCGDYFHNWSTGLDICMPCMKREHLALGKCDVDSLDRIKQRRELERYSQVRYCGFFHDHQGTTAALQILSSKDLRYKIKKENLLHLYQTQTNMFKK